ncbi:hypothetical protein XspCFBP7912_10885 [Xanthomonas sp. CFBP 7912]|nr:hypothetical protein XspCFBP7912_10885 [Xanthomonas sp. CFBP 7912]RJS05408.1 hypothetical protein XnspCFBP7698_04145 [Xanthomonas sp. CFBP 7698]
MGGGDDRHQRHHSQDRPWAQTKMSERHRRQYSGKAGRVAAGAIPGQGAADARVSGPLAWRAGDMQRHRIGTAVRGRDGTAPTAPRRRHVNPIAGPAPLVVTARLDE